MKLRLVLVAVLLACAGMVAAEEKAAAKTEAAPKAEAATAKPDAAKPDAAKPEAPKLSYAEGNEAKLKAMGAVIGVQAAQAAAPTEAAKPADEATALGIAKANNCLACHSIETKVVGPAWRDVGKKYTGDAEAKAKLLAKVKQGGKGVWGEVPMPPNPTINEADLESMVGFILTLQ
ncbi:c-type cytochrome [Thiothrix subterranea]|uniref:Cytochrome c-551 n=1 Tax=Thiothrix subterranea TaxID=2735563 RepID=A0AA51QZQ6_9GAMM|nr:c-type cytochrome [Thiothrix subterranea]MDQ5768698.1 c-type cytochrome [Thiothrix subterranea]WML84849.1 c-type cytochrome [Thiothrix subterranea]